MLRGTLLLALLGLLLPRRLAADAADDAAHPRHAMRKAIKQVLFHLIHSFILRSTMRLDISSPFSRETVVFSSQASQKCCTYFQVHPWYRWIIPLYDSNDASVR